MFNPTYLTFPLFRINIYRKPCCFNTSNRPADIAPIILVLNP